LEKEKKEQKNQKNMKKILTIAVSAILFALIQSNAMAAEGSVPNGSKIEHDLIQNTCSKDKDGNCNGNCQYQDYSVQKCKNGTGACSAVKTKVGDPYYGTCKKSGTFMIGFVFDIIKKACSANASYSCGGNCVCKK
jgi:hypothetical protein